MQDRIKAILFLFLSSILLFSCGEKADFRSAREKWEDQNAEDYDFVIRRVCFCPGYGEVKMVVQQGVVTDILDPVADTTINANGTSQPLLEADPGYARTIDQLFEEIDQAYKDNYDEVSVIYSEEMGYPMNIGFDPMKNAVDDELSYEISSLQVK